MIFFIHVTERVISLLPYNFLQLIIYLTRIYAKIESMNIQNYLRINLITESRYRH